jgi:predicted dehydrogenase
MGIQIQSNPEYRMAVRLIHDGVIGRIREVHSWSDKQWGETKPIPDRADPIPDGFNWDFWIGVCQPRPFVQGCYHPGEWRRRLDFGTGTFGDMGCHILDPVFGALELTTPTSVRSEGAAPNASSWAINASIRYTFPATRRTLDGIIPLNWYDGDRRPPADIRALVGAADLARLPGQGSIFVGTNGALLLPHIGWPSLFPESQFKGFSLPDVGRADHWLQFLDAIQGKGRTTAGFDYAGPLTETVLLGGVSTHFPAATLEWDAAGLRFPNAKEANRYVRRTYRKGWRFKDL